jgi:hypothetical protein
MTVRAPLFCLAGIAMLMASCTTSTPVSLDYQPNLIRIVNGPKVVGAGRFSDQRGMEAYRLGTVRTPIGTPLEDVVTKIPVEEVVRNSFAYGLNTRNMLATRGAAPYVITGEILELYCQQLVHPAAYCKIRVTVVRAGSGQILFSRIYQAEREASAYLPFTGSPVPQLRDLTSRALQDVVDHALDDAALRASLDSGRAG